MNPQTRPALVCKIEDPVFKPQNTEFNPVFELQESQNTEFNPVFEL